jgi:hypothetical protein
MGLDVFIGCFIRHLSRKMSDKRMKGRFIRPLSRKMSDKSLHVAVSRKAFSTWALVIPCAMHICALQISLNDLIENADATPPHLDVCLRFGSKVDVLCFLFFLRLGCSGES